MIKMSRGFIVSLVLIIFTTLANAECPQFYPNSKPIQPLNSTELCNSFFVTQYDESNKMALFSSERLAPGNHDIPRKNSFHADKRVINPVRPEVYYRSGKDKGHLVPSNDATTEEEMYDTYKMTNMTPQNPKLNRGPWKALENRVRKIAKNAGMPIIVVTGAIYGGNEKIGDLVPVPTGYYKIVYVPNQKPQAFYAENTNYSAPYPVKVMWINSRTNLKFPKE